MFEIKQRAVPKAAYLKLIGQGLTAFEAQLLASRGVTSRDELHGPLTALHSHTLLHNAQFAAEYLLSAIQQKRKICIVADFDCDGATACAVAVRGLRAFGADVDFRVPDRQIHGYGLTESIVQAIVHGSDDVAPVPGVSLLVTVDNGISSFGGVDEARKLGLDVLVTDHHLAPPAGLPAAVMIVNPNQPDCGFPSKSIAGCGVMWYVLWAMQDLARKIGHPVTPGFKVSSLLPLVAIGTVADVVTLDRNNRILVEAGLARIRDKQAFPGIDALLANPRARMQAWRLNTTDIAFSIGPRINAAGRLDDMALGINCLVTQDKTEAMALATKLGSLNVERQDVEQAIVEEAVKQTNELLARNDRYTIVLHNPEWHAGVIGIVAGRVKEQLYRPTFVLTAADQANPAAGVKGSGRSVPGVHLKDLLDYVDKHHPGLLKKFGGHAMAAGLTLREGGVAEFTEALEAAFIALCQPESLQPILYYDMPLPTNMLNAKRIQWLKFYPWGQNFPEPAFLGQFEVLSAEMGGVRKNQLKMRLRIEGIEVDAVRFRHEGALPSGQIEAVVKLDLNHFKKGGPYPQLMVEWLKNTPVAGVSEMIMPLSAEMPG